jgi:hypothetical protein
MELYVGVVFVYLLLYAGVFMSDIVTMLLYSSLFDAVHVFLI